MVKGIYTITFMLSIFLFSCHSKSHDDKKKEKNIHHIEQLNNGRFKGGILRLNTIDNIKNLNPLMAKGIGEERIIAQIYEGLVKANPYSLEIKPAIAHSWDVSEDGLTYLFYLNTSVFFHENNRLFGRKKTRAVLAKDVAYCLDRLLEKKEKGTFASHFSNVVLGNEPSKNPIEVINDSVLRIRLSEPNSSFIHMLSHNKCAIYPIEYSDLAVYEKPFLAVGTGPFTLKSINPNIGAVLEKNTNYNHKDVQGNKLPYLSEIHFSFIKDKREEYRMFREGKIDVLLDLNLNSLNEVVYNLSKAVEGKNLPIKVNVTPLAHSVNLFFHGTFSFFDSPIAKTLINEAIDRESITNYSLLGDAEAVNESILPGFFGKYASHHVKGFSFNKERLKKKMKVSPSVLNSLRAKEVYLQSSTGNGLEEKIILEVSKMLKSNLGLRVKILKSDQPVPNHKCVLKCKTTNIMYPDPVHFIDQIFKEIKKEEPGEANENLENLLWQAKSTKLSQRSQQMSNLEAWMLTQIPYIPVYFKEATVAHHNRVLNFPHNSLNLLDFTETSLSY